VRKSLFLALTAALLMVRSASAQPEARFQVAHTGVDTLKKDLKYLVELSPTPALKKQWENTLEPLIDSFAEGFDPAKPIRVDVIFGKEISFEMHFPVSLFDKGGKGFVPNIKGMGFDVKPVGANTNLYTVVEAGAGANKKPYYMRHVNGYASIAAAQAAVPANMPDPITDNAKGVQPLLEKGYGVIGSMKNSAAAADVAARRANFQALRKQLEAGLAFKRNEDKNEFALRKLTLIQNLAEAERFVVETDELLFGWTTTIAAKEAVGKGRAEFSISALPDTDLFKSSSVLATKPSYFANVTLKPDAVVSGKINFGIDPLRVEHLKEFYKTVRPVLEARIDKRETLKEADQKAAAKKAANLLIDMADEGLPLAKADLFMDLHSAGGGKHTLICGTVTTNGHNAVEIIKLLPKINAGRAVKLDIEKIGDDIRLHSVTVPDRRKEAFQTLFPGEDTIYVATSKDAVWGAIGVNAVAELKAAIQQAAAPAPNMVDPRVMYFTAHAARLVELLDIVRPEPQKIDEKLSKQEQERLKTREKDLEKIRKLAIEATANCDALFSGEVRKTGSRVEGSLDVSECVLKFVGAVTADFAKVFQ
jgi:hypothetical protein